MPHHLLSTMADGKVCTFAEAAIAGGALTEGHIGVLAAGAHGGGVHRCIHGRARRRQRKEVGRGARRWGPHTSCRWCSVCSGRLPLYLDLHVDQLVFPVCS